MELSCDLSGLNAALDNDERHLVGQTRPAAQAMAQVFYDQLRANVESFQHTGTLYRSIYQFYLIDESSPTSASYAASWRSSGKKQGLPHAWYGRLVEWGYVKRYHTYLNRDGKWVTDRRRPLDEPRMVPGKAFARNAFEQARHRAMEQGETVLMGEWND